MFEGRLAYSSFQQKREVCSDRHVVEKRQCKHCRATNITQRKAECNKMLKLCWFFPWLITMTVTIWKDNQIAAKRSLQLVEMRHNSKGSCPLLWINPVHSGRLMSFIQKQTTLNDCYNKQHITVPFCVMKLTKVPYSAGNQCDHCKKSRVGYRCLSHLQHMSI